MLDIVTIHLKSDIDFTHAGGLHPKRHVHVMLNSIQSQGHKMGLVIVAVEFPGQMVPLIGRRR